VALARRRCEPNVQPAGVLGAKAVPHLEILGLRLVGEHNLKEGGALALPLVPAASPPAFLLLCLRFGLRIGVSLSLLLLSGSLLGLLSLRIVRLGVAIRAGRFLLFLLLGCLRGLAPFVLLVALALVKARSDLDVRQLQVEQACGRAVGVFAIESKDLHFYEGMGVVGEDLTVVGHLLANDELRREAARDFLTLGACPVAGQVGEADSTLSQALVEQIDLFALELGECRLEGIEMRHRLGEEIVLVPEVLVCGG